MIPCPICQTELPPETISRTGYPIHVCSACGTKVEAKDGQARSWCFEVQFRGENLKLLFILNLFGKGRHEFSVSTEEKEILRINTLPKITPANAIEKLKLYLLFS